MIKALDPGDVVSATWIDRPAYPTFDLFAVVEQIVDAKAQFRSLAEPWAERATFKELGKSYTVGVTTIFKAEERKSSEVCGHHGRDEAL